MNPTKNYSIEKAYFGKRGRPGKVGGSLPRGLPAAVKSNLSALEESEEVERAKNWYKNKIYSQIMRFHDLFRPLDYLIDKDFLRRKKLSEDQIAELKREHESTKSELASDWTKWVLDRNMAPASYDSQVKEVEGSFKHLVVSRLSDIEKSTRSYGYADKVVGAWAEHSSTGESLVTQVAASAEFGAPLSDWAKREYEKEFKPSGKESEDELYHRRQILRLMYSRTQESLKDFPEYVTLFRGSSDDQIAEDERGDGTEVVLVSNPLSSWTTDLEVAERFGKGMVFKMRVHKSRILSTPLTGLGCLAEKEFVVIGAKGDVAHVI